MSNFSNVCKGISKMTSQNHGKRLEIQSHQRRDLYLYPARNGGPKTGSGGGRHHPPTLLGLKSAHFTSYGSKRAVCFALICM